MPHREYIKIAQGADCAVLLVHGIVSTPRSFDPFLSAIPEGCAIYNICLDGHGAGVNEFSRTSMDRWKRQVDGRLAELCARYERVVVIAHSLGTLLSIHAAPRYPQVKAMLLLDVPLHVRVRLCMIPLALKAVFGKLDGNDPREAAFRDSVGLALSRRLWLYLGWLPRFWELLCLCRQTRENVTQLKIPCTVLHSRKDELVSIRSARYFQDKPHMTHGVLESSGHFYFPDEDAEQIRTCIKNLF